MEIDIEEMEEYIKNKKVVNQETLYRQKKKLEFLKVENDLSEEEFNKKLKNIYKKEETDIYYEKLHDNEEIRWKYLGIYNNENKSDIRIKLESLGLIVGVIFFFSGPIISVTCLSLFYVYKFNMYQALQLISLSFLGILMLISGMHLVSKLDSQIPVEK